MAAITQPGWRSRRTCKSLSEKWPLTPKILTSSCSGTEFADLPGKTDHTPRHETACRPVSVPPDRRTARIRAGAVGVHVCRRRGPAVGRGGAPVAVGAAGYRGGRRQHGGGGVQPRFHRLCPATGTGPGADAGGRDCWQFPGTAGTAGQGLEPDDARPHGGQLRAVPAGLCPVDRRRRHDRPLAGWSPVPVFAATAAAGASAGWRTRILGAGCVGDRGGPAGRVRAGGGADILPVRLGRYPRPHGLYLLPVGGGNREGSHCGRAGLSGAETPRRADPGA
jgi:hypothetical protein